MTADSGSFWAAVTAPRNPAEARARARHPASQPGQPDPPPAQTVAAPFTVESMADYARNRDAILAEFGSGPRSGEWMGGVDKPQPRRTLTAEEMAELGMGYGAHADTGYTPRDPSYQEQQHTAAAGTSLGAAPATTSSIVPERS